MSSEPARPADVLYVDSDPADALMAQESFAQAGNNVRLHIARDGRQALRFVRRLGEFRGAPRPRLILLELSLADVPGLRVLAELKADSDLMTIPVVIFSSSQDPACIRRSYALHAHAYIVKPADFDGFASVVRRLSASFIWRIQPPPGTASR
jgi:CheY-like chemotaxis protein